MIGVAGNPLIQIQGDWAVNIQTTLIDYGSVWTYIEFAITPVVTDAEMSFSTNRYVDAVGEHYWMDDIKFVKKSDTYLGDIGTLIKLNRPTYRYYNIDSVSSATAFTYDDTDLVLGGKSKIFINNAVSEPTLTDESTGLETPIKRSRGDAWVTATDMYMYIEYDGINIEYWFELI